MVKLETFDESSFSKDSAQISHDILYFFEVHLKLRGILRRELKKFPFGRRILKKGGRWSPPQDRLVYLA